MTAPRGRPEAIVRPAAVDRAFTVSRHPLREASLSAVAEYHWLVRWDLDRRHEQQVVPQPRVHLVAEAGRLLIHGVNRARFTRELEGRGHAFGLAFRPGGFRPLIRGPVADLTDVIVPAEALLGIDDRAVAAAILGTDDVEAMVAVLEAALVPIVPAADPVVARVQGWVAAAERDVDVVRAEQLAERVGVSLRTLQRTFAEYVGVGPKWVIQRFRVLEALAAANDGAVTDWTALAEQLGFADQSHLINVFGEVVGTPPDTYQREVADEG